MPNETKWTPGPWVMTNPGGGPVVDVAPENEIRRPLAFLPAGDRTRAENLANAALIAAAPEMYEALRDIIEQADRCMMMIPADLADSIKIFGRAALAKADGKAP